ncbi:DNA-binding HxlR family transcriptional regulator [Mycetocola sp. CAN_C7]|uniref:winged helix-turn-helix transcriptional regulator n=1 Tax=Mycetocola sp. CAN_C7 TaxID=2787724 RepID=UPI0018C9C133
MAARNYGQHSGVVHALELVGERWALLIVRDLLVGPRRYTDLKAGLPRIPTNILSSRLKELQEGGVIRRAPLLRSIVYELTAVGRELEPIILALGRWGLQSMGEAADDDIISAESLTVDLRAAFHPDAAGSLPATSYLVHIDDVTLALDVDGSTLSIAPRSDLPAVDLEFSTGPEIYRILSGALSPEEAIDDGIVRIIAGNPPLLDRFTSTFTHAQQAVAF